MKVETVTQFVAEDGTRFESMDACQKHEAESVEVARIFHGIPEWPKKHGSFIEVPRRVLITARRNLWELVIAKYGEHWPKWKEWDADEVHPRSVVGRVLDDNGHGPIESAWNKMAAWDFEKGRIYDQPYFVEHAEEAQPA